MEDIFDANYIFGAQNAPDEPYYAAGTHHRLPQTSDDIPTAQQLDQDVDAGLLDLGLTVDIPESSFDDTTAETWNLDFNATASRPYLSVTSSTNAVDNAFAQIPRRTNSGLNAAARPFVPSAQQWPTDFDVLSGILPPATPQPQPQTQTQTHQTRMQQLTPLQTRFDFNLPTTPPDSNQTRSQSGLLYSSQPSAWLLSPNAALLRPHPMSAGIHGWSSETPPAQAIGTWARQTSHPFPGPVPEQGLNPALLTPTPSTPTYAGSALERTTSRTTTSATYLCDHEGCGKEFNARTDFTHHRRNHGERNHVCSICEKSFVFRKDLNRHIKTHRPAERHFFCNFAGCPYCVKGFQRKDHCDRHIKTHTRNGVLTPSASSAPMSRDPSSL